MGVFDALTPHMRYLAVFYVISGLSSYFGNGLNTGGNVLCLNIWEGLDGSPFMHSIHFSFGLGAFLSPFVAIPFLSSEDEPETRITILYPILGSIAALVSCGYLLVGILERNKELKAKKVKEKVVSKPMTKAQWIFLALMCAFFLFYVGCECSYGLYLTTYAVKGLGLLKPTGAKITSMFWGTFSAMRFVAIFAAMKLKTLYIMVISCLLSVAGAIVLVVSGDSSEMALYIASGLLGAGMASIFASGILWSEEYLIITNKIGAAFTVVGTIGYNVFPILVGQFIEEHPDFFVYLTVALIGICTVIFVLSMLVGKLINKDDKA